MSAVVEQEIVEDVWLGLYGESWKGLICDEAFAHPAKFSRALIRRIYDHVIAEGWATRGSSVVDPFGGVALGAFDAMRHGLNWHGCELETRFVLLSQANIAKWAERCCLCDEHDRTKVCRMREAVSQGEGRSQPNAEVEVRPVLQPSLFQQIHVQGEEPLAGTYRGNEGADPVEQGQELDARNEAKTIGLGEQRIASDGKERQLEGRKIDTPGRVCDDSSERQAETRAPSRCRNGARGTAPAVDHGSSRKEQAGQQPIGSLTNDTLGAYETSPSERGSQTDQDDHLCNLQQPVSGYTPSESVPKAGVQKRATAALLAQARREKKAGTFCPDCHKPVAHIPTILQGDSRNLSEVLRAAECCISSPPYVAVPCRSYPASTGSREHGRMTEAWDVHQKTAAEGAGYGDSMGQLGAMREGDHSLVISSPPYVSGGHHNDIMGAWNANGRGQGVSKEEAGYGKTEGQLGAMPEGSLCVTSPPYNPPMSQDHNGTRGGSRGTTPSEKGAFVKYGNGEGQLEGMPMGGFDAAISSPPYERDTISRDQRPNGPTFCDRTYGSADGQLGSTSGETFWSASRLILEQLHQVIAPGSHTVFVVKAFVRDKQIVDFPAQWAQLCEAVGFRLLHHHRASLVEHSGTQRGFEQDREIRVERKSFFRRLAEKKGSPRIDHESVLCFERQ